jgi:tetratricopeptide (TPR) repeat protein
LEIENRKQKVIGYFGGILFYFLLLPQDSFTQDSIPQTKDFSEERALEFQQFFFEALSQKAIGKHQKAIENLENCNQILPNNTTVFFEFSKNYLALDNVFLAKEYINRALEQDDKIVWLQKHLVKVLLREQNYKEAIKVQKEIIAFGINERPYLVELYLQNKEYKRALELMLILEKESLLPWLLREVKDSLGNTAHRYQQKDRSKLTVFQEFESNNSYVALKIILEAATTNNTLLLKYSAEGMRLFPAQAFVYLKYGSALNIAGTYNMAITTLENGLDFVFEEAMEAAFYKELYFSNLKLGNAEGAEKYRIKLEKLKR